MRVLQDRLIALLDQCLGFRGSDLIDGLVQMRDDVKPIQDVDRLRGLLGCDLEVGLPHIAADELQVGGTFLAEPADEMQQHIGLATLSKARWDDAQLWVRPNRLLFAGSPVTMAPLEAQYAGELA